MFGGFGAGGLAMGMLVSGLVASPLHCAPMCGGFVLGQVSDRMARLPSAHMSECGRLRAGALPSYHLGRLTTYTAIGVAMGGGGFALRSLGAGSGIFLLLGAALLTLQALRRLRPGFALPLTRAIRGYRLGVALGFLPCGILYAAFAAAAATASPLLGGMGMLCFGLGTIPMLAAVGVLGAAAGGRFQRGLGRIAPAILLFNAALLAAIGVRMLAGS